MLLRLLLSLLLVCTAPVAALAHAGCTTVADEPAAQAHHHHHHAMPEQVETAGCCDVLCVNLCLAATMLPPAPAGVAVSSPAISPALWVAGQIPLPLPELLLRPPRTLLS